MWKLLNKWDIGLIVGVLLFSLSFYFFVRLPDQKEAGVAHIYYDAHLVATMDLSQNDTLLLTQEKYPMLLADLEIEIRDGKVRIAKETSPHHICSQQGWTNSVALPLVCLPNRVYVQIEKGDTFDGVDAVVQ